MRPFECLEGGRLTTVGRVREEGQAMERVTSARAVVVDRRRRARGGR